MEDDPGRPMMLPLERLLAENQVEDYDERVIYQLIEYQYRTTKEILETCKSYASLIPSQGNEISENIVQCAVERLEETRRPVKAGTIESSSQLMNSLGDDEGKGRIPSHYFINDTIHNMDVMDTVDQLQRNEGRIGGSVSQYNVTKKNRVEIHLS